MDQIDHSAPASNRLLLGMLIVSALLALALVGIAALADFESRDEDDPAGAAAHVEGTAITAAQVAVVEQQVANHHDTPGQASHADGDDRPSFQSLIDRHGPETVALGLLVVQTLPEVELERRGLAVDPADVDAAVAEQRERYTSIRESEHGGDSDLIAEQLHRIEDAIALVGEPAYWDEVIAGDQRHRLALAALGDSDPPRPGSAAWSERMRTLIADADIAVHPPLAAAVSDADVRAVVETYLALTGPQ